MSILVEDELLIGRHAEGAGRLAEDDEISRSHARVTFDASGFCAIEDVGSTNGTFVNGLRISVPQTLAEGDTIELGATTLAVRELPQAGFVEAPEPSEGATLVPGAQPGLAPEAGADLEGVPALAAGVASPTRSAAVSPLAPEQTPLEPSPPEPEPIPPHPTAGQAPALALRVEVDFATREARVVLDGASEPVRLELEDGVWRPAATPSA
jgi:predicted component of type VI protein secretion system